MDPNPHVERTPMSELAARLDLQQAQIVDLQQRVTAVETTPGGARTDGGGLDLVPLVVKAVGALARAAADAGGQGGEVLPLERPEVRPSARIADVLNRAAERRGTLRASMGGAASEVEQEPAQARHEAHQHTPLFPITEPEPAGRTAPRLTPPPEVPIRLWNANYTEHHDTVGRADDEGPNVWRVRPEKAEAARAWIQELRDDYGDQATLHAVVLDRPWSVRGWSFWDHTGLILRLEPLPKPPRVDQALHREDLAIDLGPARPKVTDYLDKSRCPGCQNPTGHGHYPWCPQAHGYPDLQAGDRIAAEHPDGTIREYTFSGDPEHPVAEPDSHKAMERNIRALYNIRNDVAEPVGTVTSGLVHTPPEPCCDGGDGFHEPACPVTQSALGRSAPDVDEVLPMPGGPNDRLAQAPKRLCRAKHPVSLNTCIDATGHRGPHTSWPGDTWPVGEVATGYGDLYARLDHLHDATAEDDQ